VICRETSEITAHRARQNLALARAARAGTHATIDTDAVDLILTAGIAAVLAAVGVLELRGKRLFAGLDAFVRNLGRGAAGREWSDSPIRGGKSSAAGVDREPLCSCGRDLSPPRLNSQPLLHTRRRAAVDGRRGVCQGGQARADHGTYNPSQARAHIQVSPTAHTADVTRSNERDGVTIASAITSGKALSP
jgi:hypothetical protein